MSEFIENLVNDWRVTVIMLLLLFISGFMIYTHVKVSRLETELQTVKSTTGSIESVVISTDNNISGINEKVRSLESNIAYIVQRVKPR